MTNAERKRRREAKRRLQEEGLIRPDKPRLNREKYVKEAEEELNNFGNIGFFYKFLYMHNAVITMLCHRDRNGRVSQEAVGAAKCIKMAVRLKEFDDRLKEEGREEYTVEEHLEFIKDIFDA